MKAIETRYNGHRFRSRTEARWAVLFDHLGVAYEYEPEGFELEDGTRYLPDFYMPREDCYFEIKGTWPDRNEIHKAGLLAHRSLRFVNMLVGQPGQHEMIAFRPVPAATPETLAWLDAAPSEWLRWQAAGLAARNVAVPQHYVDSPWTSRLHPVYDTRYRPQGLQREPKDVHLELDYDPDVHRLVVWDARPSTRPGNAWQDGRYGFFAVTEEFRVYASGEPMGIPSGSDEWARITREEYYSPTGEIRLSRKFDEAVEAARSARFEFGESGAG